MADISFIIPCYHSEHTLEHVVKEIRDTMASMAGRCYEIILINDSSPDGTMNVIRELCERYDNITGISLSRNFGQHAALMAGFRYASGEIILCLDDDGQTPADEANKLIEAVEGGRDVVYARYGNKKHTAFRNFGSKVNEIMTRFMLGKPKDLYVSSYFAARRFVIEEVIRYENSYPYVIGLVLRSTKNIGNVDVTHRERESGHSGYTMKKLFALWFNGFTAFSIQPLRFATLVGSACAVSGFIYGIYTIIKRFLNPQVPIGFSSLMSMLVFIGGMIMLMLGLIGEYLGRIYISLNNSPQYVIREMIGQKSKEEKHPAKCS